LDLVRLAEAVCEGVVVTNPVSVVVAEGLFVEDAVCDGELVIVGVSVAN
jgi:hypothetical protein